MKIEELVGTYTVSGINQDEERTSYEGLLTLSLADHDRIEAKWLIGGTEEQYGIGFFKDNILVIDFYYFDEILTKYNGIVVYKLINSTVLDGFWTEELGHKDYVGKEKATKKV